MRRCETALFPVDERAESCDESGRVDPMFDGCVPVVRDQEPIAEVTVESMLAAPS